MVGRRACASMPRAARLGRVSIRQCGLEGVARHKARGHGAVGRSRLSVDSEQAIYAKVNSLTEL